MCTYSHIVKVFLWRFENMYEIFQSIRLYQITLEPNYFNDVQSYRQLQRPANLAKWSISTWISSSNDSGIFSLPLYFHFV